MGRFEDASADLEATTIDLMMGPDEGRPEETLRNGVQNGKGWRLFFHPLWSFRYLAGGRQLFHMVDAVGGHPVGPANRVRWIRVSLLSSASLLALFLIGRSWIGPIAALPAWLLSLAAMRWTQRVHRKP